MLKNTRLFVYFKFALKNTRSFFILKNFVLKNTRSFRNGKFLSRKILVCISITKSCVEKYSIKLNFAASHGSNMDSTVFFVKASLSPLGFYFV